MTILCFLQNVWVKDAQGLRDIFSRHPENRVGIIRRLLFYKCLTGRRINACFGDDLIEKMIFEEASLEMGKCWHEQPIKREPYCIKCKQRRGHLMFTPNNVRFHTWPGFGLLFEWAQKQDWWSGLYFHIDSLPDEVKWPSPYRSCSIIYPDSFADAVYQFLKERK